MSTSVIPDYGLLEIGNSRKVMALRTNADQEAFPSAGQKSISGLQDGSVSKAMQVILLTRFFIAAINTVTQRNLGRKGFI